MPQFDEQENLLDEALSNVRQHSHQMELCLEKRNLEAAIYHASDMLREMKTSTMSPKSYYQLYMAVTDKLRLLEAYLLEEHRCSRKPLCIYETVQYIPYIVPRLYLLITVGVFLIKCSLLCRRDILRDLMDMCCGVQHPVRGLFLRSYLLHSLPADLLPTMEDPSDFTSNAINATVEPSTGDLERPTVETEGCADSSTNEPSHITPKSQQQQHESSQQGTISDSIQFLLMNFAEMNKLWVRLQHLGHTRDRERREQERRELRLLVGTNLNRLAQLEAITVLRYRMQVLPALLEQLIQCRDTIAQEYLMDVIIQVFPDEFHLATLHLLLRACSHLQTGVKPRLIICSLIDRLSQYATQEVASGNSISIPVEEAAPTANNGEVDLVGCTNEEVECDDTLYALFFREVAQLLNARLALAEMNVAEARGSGVPLQQASRNLSNAMLLKASVAAGLPSEDIPTIYTALAYLAMTIHPHSSPPLVDACCNATADVLARLGISQVPPGSALSRELLRLLHLPLDGSTSPTASGGLQPSSLPLGALMELRTVLNMTGFRRLVDLLDPHSAKRRLACHLLAGALDREQRQRSKTNDTTGNAYSARLNNEADLQSLFELVDCLLVPVASDDRIGDPDEFVEAQSLVAGMLHLLGPKDSSTDLDSCFRLLQFAKQRFASTPPSVVQFNLPALVFEGLKLVQAYYATSKIDPEWQTKVEKVVEFCHGCATLLVASDSSESALRLFLQAASVIDAIPFKRRESMAYEFFSQALTLYEEGVSESRAQLSVITLITGTLCRMRCFTEDNRNTLRSQCARAAAHLLRKPDQCRAMANVAYLYWPTDLEADESETNEKQSNGITSEATSKLRDGIGVVNCLDRAAKLADDCMDVTVRTQLYTGLLNHAIRLSLAKCTEVTDDRINSYIGAIEKLLDSVAPGSVKDHITTHMTNTLAIISHHQQISDASSASDPREREVRAFFADVKI